MSRPLVFIGVLGSLLLGTTDTLAYSGACSLRRPQQHQIQGGFSFNRDTFPEGRSVPIVGRITGENGQSLFLVKNVANRLDAINEGWFGESIAYEVRVASCIPQPSLQDQLVKDQAQEVIEARRRAQDRRAPPIPRSAVPPLSAEAHEQVPSDESSASAPL